MRQGSAAVQPESRADRGFHELQPSQGAARQMHPTRSPCHRWCVPKMSSRCPQDVPKQPGSFEPSAHAAPRGSSRAPRPIRWGFTPRNNPVVLRPSALPCSGASNDAQSRFLVLRFLLEAWLRCRAGAGPRTPWKPLVLPAAPTGAAPDPAGGALRSPSQAPLSTLGPSRSRHPPVFCP